MTRKPKLLADKVEEGYYYSEYCSLYDTVLKVIQLADEIKADGINYKSKADKITELLIEHIE